ncbi:hypothetical protein Tco_1017505 [Tanacetum coccineum]|uniref:Response regulatory domain-containing protein n=1 Tax=Tanacetum coccineum TaxID=301880 RepID=A0ABQ5FRX3_9ASTR
MANLELCDKHNMVDYLKKPTGSEEFQEIVDFLNESHIRGFSGEQTPLFPSMLAIQAEEGEGSRHPSEPQPPPSTTQPIHEEPILNVTSEPILNVPDEAIYEEWNGRVERATTTAASLDAAQASGGSPRCQEATGGSFAQTRVLALETDLRQTKKVYGAAYTKLIMKVKKLEKTVKSNQARRRAKIVVSDDEEDLEESSKQGMMIEEIDQDA